MLNKTAIVVKINVDYFIPKSYNIRSTVINFVNISQYKLSMHDFVNISQYKLSMHDFIHKFKHHSVQKPQSFC